MAKSEIINYVLVFTKSELDTIIASLRFWQGHDQCKAHNRSAELHDIATGGGEHGSLKEDELDKLCERIISPHYDDFPDFCAPEQE